jgi:hypothetical protein
LVLTAVTYPGSKYKSETFQLDSKCFEGNYGNSFQTIKGNMALVQNCPSFSSPITWYINKEGQFILKVLDAGESKGVKFYTFLQIKPRQLSID